MRFSGTWQTPEITACSLCDPGLTKLGGHTCHLPSCLKAMVDIKQGVALSMVVPMAVPTVSRQSSLNLPNLELGDLRGVRWGKRQILVLPHSVKADLEHIGFQAIRICMSGEE